MRFSNIKWPHQRRKGRVVYNPRYGTRLLTIGDDIRTRLSSGPTNLTPAERAVFGWLQRFDISFDFQVPVMGGRGVPGGAVVDFLLYITDPPTVLRVQSFWHTDPQQRETDAAQKSMLEMKAQYRVEDIWEWETMDWDTLSRRMVEIVFGNMPAGAGSTYSLVVDAYSSPKSEEPTLEDKV